MAGTEQAAGTVMAGTVQAAGDAGPRRTGLVLEPASRGQGLSFAQTSCTQWVANAKSFVMSCSDNCLHYSY